MVVTAVSDDARAEIWAAVDAFLADPGGAGAPPVGTGRASGVTSLGWLPVAVLGGLAAVDHVHGYVLAVLAPEIGAALGVAASGVAAVLFVRVVGYLLGARATAGRGRVPGGVGAFAAAGALAWSAAALFAGAVAGLWALLAAAAVYGAASASVPVAHPGLLRSFYGERSPAVEAHRNAGRLGNIVAAALPGVVVALGGGWQAAFLVAGCVSLPLALALAVVLRRCRGNGLGTTRRIASAPHAEALGRLVGVPVVRRLLLVMAAVAVLEIPMYAYLFTLLHERWAMGPAGRGALAAALEGVSLVISILMVRRRRGIARTEPARLLLGLAAALVLGAAALIGFTVAPSRPVALVCVAATALVLSPIIPLLWVGPMAIVGVRRADGRRAGAELAGIVAAGVTGLLLAAAAEGAAGPAGALLFLAPLLLVPAALAVWTAVQVGSTVSSERRSSAGVGASALASESSRIASA
jgi:hypothetical protein